MRRKTKLFDYSVKFCVWRSLQMGDEICVFWLFLHCCR